MHLLTKHTNKGNPNRNQNNINRDMETNPSREDDNTSWEQKTKIQNKEIGNATTLQTYIKKTTDN